MCRSDCIGASNLTYDEKIRISELMSNADLIGANEFEIQFLGYIRGDSEEPSSQQGKAWIAYAKSLEIYIKNYLSPKLLRSGFDLDNNKYVVEMLGGNIKSQEHYDIISEYWTWLRHLATNRIANLNDVQKQFVENINSNDITNEYEYVCVTYRKILDSILAQRTNSGSGSHLPDWSTVRKSINSLPLAANGMIYSDTKD